MGSSGSTWGQASCSRCSCESAVLQKAHVVEGVCGVHPCVFAGACASLSSAWYVTEAMHRCGGRSHASVHVMGGARVLVGA